MATARGGVWAFAQSIDIAALPAGAVGILLGADYRYRDGGAWAKQALWLRSGLVWSSERWTVKAARVEAGVRAARRM